MLVLAMDRVGETDSDDGVEGEGKGGRRGGGSDGEGSLSLSCLTSTPDSSTTASLNLLASRSIPKVALLLLLALVVALLGLMMLLLALLPPPPSQLPSLSVSARSVMGLVHARLKQYSSSCSCSS
jgi:hypothetical protein